MKHTINQRYHLAQMSLRQCIQTCIEKNGFLNTDSLECIYVSVSGPVMTWTIECEGPIIDGIAMAFV